MNNTNTKKWVRLSVVLYIVILAVIGVATFAWFLFDETATLQTANNMQITAGNKLEIVLVDRSWNPIRDEEGKLVSDWSSSQGVSTEDFTYPDITGDGLHFYFPKALDGDDQPYASSDSYLEITDDFKDRDLYYITVCVKFRTTLPMDIYLANGSVVAGVEDLEDGSYENKSIFGNVSRDSIAGAIRVAFIEYTADSEYILKNVWVPNDKYQLSYRDAAANESSIDGKVAEFTTDGAREDFIGFLTESTDGATMVKQPYDITSYINRKVTLGSQPMAVAGDTGVPMINESASLLSFTATDIEQGGGIAEKRLIIKIWVEGTDREADKAFMDGRLNYMFKFSGIDKAVYAENDNDDIVCNGSSFYYRSTNVAVGASVLEYSYNGIDWTPYSGQLSTVPENTTSVYVRYQETANVRASEAMVVPLG